MRQVNQRLIPFRSMVMVTCSGRSTIDNPINTPAAGYVGINWASPLTVYNLGWFVCIVDSDTGMLHKSKFTK